MISVFSEWLGQGPLQSLHTLIATSGQTHPSSSSVTVNPTLSSLFSVSVKLCGQCSWILENPILGSHCKHTECACLVLQTKDAVRNSFHVTR